MLASILIVLFSVVLFVYWFRYTCLLILENQAERTFANKVAKANRLSFPEVQQRLRGPDAQAGLDGLHRSLENDYQVLRYLLRHAAGLHSTEQRMLELDYRVMQFWYRLTRRSSGAQARKALEEMSGILSYFANKMGERAASFSQA